MKFNRVLAASVLASSMLMTSNVHATDSFNSEASHFIFGAALAGGITAVVDHWYPEQREYRGWWGFGISSVGAALESLYEYNINGNGRNQAIDAASHIAGSALGAYVTDQYILEPVIKNSASEGRYIGVNLIYTAKQ
jgi:peptidoglycan/LPS O-acetylase OafA/YrhL